MPFVSQAQKGWMYANHPAMAKKWQAHTPKGKNLPEHVDDAQSDTKNAADLALQAALADPLTSFRGAYLPPAKGPAMPPIKAANSESGDQASLYSVLMKTSGDGMGGDLGNPDPGQSSPGASLGGVAAGSGLLAGMAGLGSGVGTAAMAPKGRRAEGFGRGALIGGGTVLGGMGGSLLSEGVGHAMGASPKAQALAGVLGLLGGGLAGNIGTRAAVGKPSWKEDKPTEPTMETPKAAAEKIAALIAKGRRKVASTKALVSFLDTLAASLPLTKAAGVRAIQRDVSAGRPLAQAIKQAYPSLTGEERGILGYKICRLADKQAGEMCSAGQPKVTAKKTWHGPAAGGGAQMHSMS